MMKKFWKQTVVMVARHYKCANATKLYTYKQNGNFYVICILITKKDSLAVSIRKYAHQTVSIKS